MAKYKIRDDRFAVHLSKFVDTEVGGKEGPRRKVDQSYFAGAPFELADADAMAHIHKLEPADDEAKKLFDDFHTNQALEIAKRNPVADEDISDDVLDRLEARMAARAAARKGNVGKGAAA